MFIISNEKTISLDNLEAFKSEIDKFLELKADKPINAFVLIGTENWQTDDSEGYPYYYNIPIEGASSADRAEVWFSADSEEAAKKCEFSAEVTVSDGFVKIRVKHIPETILSANVQVGVLSANNTLHINDTRSVADEAVGEHDADPEAHPDIRDYLNKLEAQVEEQIDEDIEEHNADEDAHPDIRASLRKIEKQVDEKIDTGINEHNADTAAHPDIRAYINELKGRIVALEVAAGGDITSNAFAVTFGDLDGVITDGVWVPASARLEF